MKLCRTCKETKELSEFTKDKECINGVTNICKVCTNIRRKRYREANPDQVAKIYAKNKEWKKENRDKILKQASDRFSKRDPSLKIESAKKYKTSVKGKIATVAYNRKRKNGIQATSDGTITSKTLTNLLTVQDFKCAYCNCVLDKTVPFSVHLDHVIPISKGGKHSLDNVVWSCAKCNLLKGDNLLHD